MTVPISCHQAPRHCLETLSRVDGETVARWSLHDASMPVLRRGRVVRFPRERLLVSLEREEQRTARRSAQAQHKWVA
jgi:hypothetical protein